MESVSWFVSFFPLVIDIRNLQYAVATTFSEDTNCEYLHFFQEVDCTDSSVLLPQSLQAIPDMLSKPRPLPLQLFT
jgi:hypothetical protein